MCAHVCVFLFVCFLFSCFVLKTGGADGPQHLVFGEPENGSGPSDEDMDFGSELEPRVF